MMQWLEPLVNVFYPRTCWACSRPLLGSEEHLCIDCLLELPKTNFHLQAENPLLKVFMGRCNFKAATAYFYFQKGGRVQRLLHQLKYQNMPEIGVLLGQMIGEELGSHPFLQNVDVALPVPLHPQKQLLRGYNQSAQIAEGLLEATPLVLSKGNLVRKSQSETQTRKGRFDRWRNVEQIFAVERPQEFRFRHVLLIDDVVTTGATIEACYQQLQKIEGIEISLLAVAMATN